MLFYPMHPYLNTCDVFVYGVSSKPLVYGQGYDVTDERIIQALSQDPNWSHTPPPHEHEVAADSTTVQDRMKDFQQIKGIGPQRAMAFNELNIFTLQDLADYDAHTLARLLDGSSLSQVVHWQERAMNLIIEIGE